METATLDKQEVLDWLMNQVEEVKQGNINPLDVYPHLNELEKSIKELRKELYDATISECEKYDRREDIVRGNYRISIVSRPYYQYDSDPEYTMLKQKLDNRKNLLKKATEKGKVLTDSETGEMAEPVNVKFSTYPKCEWVGNQGLS